jgi:hypothetical protein
MSKYLRFDATSLEVSSRGSKSIDVEVVTDYPDEILNEFTAEEIVKNYENINELYELLKDIF